MKRPCCGSAAVLLLMLAALDAEPNCEEVKKVFQLRQIGPSKWLPETPRSGSDLQVCTSKDPTCCTRKMEERYQAAARQDIQNLLQTSSSTLKFLISRNAAAFQETFQNIIRHAENNTKMLFRTTYRNMAFQTAAPIRELFTDVALFVFGSEINVDEFVNRFFDSLFPLVYNHLINPALTDISPDFAECVRMARKDLNPFAHLPQFMASQMAKSLMASHMFLQALNLGIEVINTTDHLQYTKECSRALLKMQFCSHCHGLINRKPCMGYCLNVMRGCLANMAEIDPHWREYIRSLEELSNGMQGTYDIEQVLLNLHSLVNDAIMNAQINGPKLSAMVNRACGHPVRKPTQSLDYQDPYSDEHGLKITQKENEETLSSRRKEFINSLRLYRALYGGLADQLCVNDLAAADGLICWNGQDIAKSYTRQVVGNGIKAQSSNPEVKVKGTDPVINQIIDKLKHINQLLQGKVIPKYEKWQPTEKGSGQIDGDDVQVSGDCDDEDGCIASGNGEVKKSFKTTNAGLPDKKNRHNFALDDVDTNSLAEDWSDSNKPGGRAISHRGNVMVILISLVALILPW
ncbi:glypican-5a isoform X1 [Scyliorhinus canicula]|uniref:glypican-5a isoform X1 n=1 Tax=Scyliorhinus canicula TaxID=7830 RepID=UPI0018F3FBA4|nr:glypican-5a isoform X1 [Scyliorhinus canicula]